jgi:hypothetical protein
MAGKHCHNGAWERCMGRLDFDFAKFYCGFELPDI